MDIEVDLSILFTKYYNDMKAKGVTFIPNSEVAKKIMLRLYDDCIKKELLLPIELLPLDEKMNLVNECRKMENIFYTNESLITSSKILHTINLINNNS